MKSIGFSICYFFFFSVATAQQWDSVPCSPQGATVYALLPDTSNNSLYVAGNFGGPCTLSFNSAIAQWDGTGWSTVGTGGNFTGSTIYALTYYNNQLYAGGYFGNCLSYLDGANWTASFGITGGTFPPGSNGLVRELKVFNNKLYITGSFRWINYTTSPDTVNSITTWDGSQLSQITDSTGTQIGINSFNGSFEGHSLYAFNNELFLGGTFTSVCGVNIPNYSIARYDGQNWFAESQTMAITPYSFITYNGELYAAGIGPHIYRYDGVDWVSIADVKDPVVPVVNAMTIYHNDLVVAGHFDSIDNVAARSIARWNGTGWSPFDGGLTNYFHSSEVFALSVFQGDLYAGGNFDSAGNALYAPCLARWSEPVGIEEIKPFSAINIYPNPVWDIIYLPQSLKEKFYYRIKETSGKLIIEGVKKESETKINIKNLSTGFYIIVFENEKQRFVGKFLKE